MYKALSPVGVPRANAMGTKISGDVQACDRARRRGPGCRLLPTSDDNLHESALIVVI